ncbi:MAG: dUTP diphosphatase [Deltaproteobacteria bacterium CG_4_8_14_3_um_filter_51_11]|nr:dUTP diphosphatase [bacterium]OIP43895.1 MAG: deoxyuridine 5'-triphosphate nucleotidohydrolase [Desulfobacteraceae bacterium CG2_30_51_40]PIP45234.1 MAG: dUTP diphosphatase [Deltaproteobacteria bacterium CG23_combo_of_CG06-09_8_20_14_all_51_20]PIX19349.1 MAG: dUTP diphosphatase [Deltaproteobacteria bacterium CG_4_8_14_3_um_filter_51_11]PIY25773.1 MAG: dUTP diphosphatase [Deltaproteobacteria bacterium CG_4_10_14_3_um_filter_51_14]PJB34967.1 MAG: dUTP diphosphatase [Deltaproteobacteria bacter
MDRASIKVMRVRGGMPDNFLEHASSGSSGMDVRAWPDEPITLDPGDIRLIPTGIALSIPEGFEAQVRPRSGLALKNGIGILNAPGTIDSDYRGEIGIILINLGKDSFTVSRGDRIAQIVIASVCKAELMEVSCLDETERGAGGFGHSGII